MHWAPDCIDLKVVCSVDDPDPRKDLKLLPPSRVRWCRYFFFVALKRQKATQDLCRRHVAIRYDNKFRFCRYLSLSILSLYRHCRYYSH